MTPHWWTDVEHDVRVAILLAGGPLLFGMMTTAYVAILQSRLQMTRAVVGDGDIPIDRILRQVLDAGYDRVFDIELLDTRRAPKFQAA